MCLCVLNLIFVWNFLSTVIRPVNCVCVLLHALFVVRLLQTFFLSCLDLGKNLFKIAATAIILRFRKIECKKSHFRISHRCAVFLEIENICCWKITTARYSYVEQLTDLTSVFCASVRFVVFYRIAFHSVRCNTILRFDLLVFGA